MVLIIKRESEKAILIKPKHLPISLPTFSRCLAFWKDFP